MTSKTVGEIAGELREAARSLLPRYALLLRRAADVLEREVTAEEVAKMRKALADCEAQFQSYAKEHRRKALIATSMSATLECNSKARTNEGMADLCAAVLNRAKQQEPIDG